MIFYAYENWRAHGHRVTVHTASCAFCNDGRGARGGSRADNGKWHKLGEFVSKHWNTPPGSRQHPPHVCVGLSRVGYQEALTGP
jgi:hypothetical protein